MSQKNPELHEQQQEVDILQGIYEDDIEVLNHAPPYKVQINCKAYLDPALQADLERFSVKVEIEMTNKYPNEIPKFEIRHHIDKVSNYEVQQVYEMVTEIANQMKGEAMIFEMVEAIRNWIQNSVIDTDLRPKKLKKKMGDKYAMEEDEEETEVVVNLTKKSTYTPVTRDSFLEWKKKFDEEMLALKKAKGEYLAINTKLSGKELFQRDAKLAVSDALEALDEDADDIDYTHEEQKEEEAPKEKLFYYDEGAFDQDVDIDEDDDE